MLFHPIGIIHTPYKEKAPRQPVPDDKGDFHIIIDPVYEPGLTNLDKHKHIFVLFWLDRQHHPLEMTVTPHHENAVPGGFFASRTPNRPNPIGLSLVQLISLENNILHISSIDALDGTPVLDIKPYFHSLDSRTD